jgi:hypothetical protein
MTDTNAAPWTVAKAAELAFATIALVTASMGCLWVVGMIVCAESAPPGQRTASKTQEVSDGWVVGRRIHDLSSHEA